MSKDKPVKVITYTDAVAVRRKNQQVVVKTQKNPENKKFAASNVIHLKSLTINSGPDPGVTSELSKNGKIKYSHIGLSDEAVLDLYVALHHYVQELKGAKVKIKKQ